VRVGGGKIQKQERKFTNNYTEGSEKDKNLGLACETIAMRGGVIEKEVGEVRLKGRPWKSHNFQ